MNEFLRGLLATDGFHPHGFCYLWKPGLIWLHVVADSLIGLAYVAIGFGLAQFVRRGRGHLPFSRMFVAFGVFIAACGATHFVEVWTLWTPAYWFAGGVKIVTAAASVFTAVALPPLIPIALNTMASARLSERRRLDLEQAHRRLTELDELKTQFFANVSHELRTPLTLILGPVEQMLREGAFPEPDRRRLETVYRNADLLLRHVNDLLDVAKLEAGRLALDYRRTDLAKLVRRAAAHFESVAMSQALPFSVEAPPTLAAEVDPEQMERVLLNLLGNAIKFAPAGGHIRCVLEEVGTAADGPRLARITVHDSGPGVPPEQRELIFEPFRQAEGGTDRRYGGTGLGLAIVADIVKLHGGRIRVEDSPLGGAAFLVEVPLRAPADAVVSNDEPERVMGRPAGAAATVPHAVAAPHAVAGPREPAAASDPDWPLVLVVEDNPEMNQFIAESLSGRYRIARAYDGRQGIDAALELRPDLIVSDVMMPVATGETLVRELRQRPDFEATPIVLLSARAEDDVRLRLLSEGVQDYLTKPFSSEELRARVSNWIEIKRARDVLRSALQTTRGNVEALAKQITARNQDLQDALTATRLAVAEAEAASRARSDFVSVMSHELRTPLNGLLGYLDLLDAGVAGPVPPAQHDYLERMRGNAEHLRALIEQVLTFSRIDAGAEEARLQRLDLRDLIRDAAAHVAPAAAAKGVALDVHVADREIDVRTDPTKVRQVLVNLLGNAVKFTEAGRVTLSAQAEDGSAVIRVEDTGPGIEPQHLEHIWEPFWQADPSKTRTAGGTGLGLAITRRLVDMLGADIRVESELGRGTSFTLRFAAEDEARPGDT